MPPTRTIPPIKAVKTERTHEENQERAYIAASRRSDRSLEARVESARRASEIHKRRTGRSLRVTEQDVINEEMYEEEDDDLPMQYRRLTAHLQTGSADFNRRLAAYLTNQVAMRSAVEQMASNPYAQPFPGAQQYPHSRPNMFQSPMTNTPLVHSPTGSYRHAPYPSPHHANFRQSHGRAYSAAVVPQTVHTPSTPGHESMDHRRMSTPAIVPPHIDTQHASPDLDYLRQTQSAQLPHSPYPPYWQDMGPFTTSLPPESQQMLAGAPALDPNDAFSASLLRGSEKFTASPYYPWASGDMHQQLKTMSPHSSSHQGMSTTLAPAALASQNDLTSDTPHSSHSAAVDSTFSTTGYDPLGLNHLDIPDKDEHSPLEIPSGEGTPGESFWNNFVQDSGWADDTNLTS